MTSLHFSLSPCDSPRFTENLTQHRLSLCLQFKQGAVVTERKEFWLQALPSLQGNETAAGMYRQLCEGSGVVGVPTKKRKSNPNQRANRATKRSTLNTAGAVHGAQDPGRVNLMPVVS